METCSNRDCNFRKRTGGYYRYSLERTVETSGLPARHHLSELTGSTFTPMKRAPKFLCPDCWNKLNEAVRYKASMEELFKSTKEATYVGRKKRGADISDDQQSTSFLKRPRFTSTPLKVSDSMS